MTDWCLASGAILETTQYKATYSDARAPSPAARAPTTVDAAAQQIAGIIVGDTVKSGLQARTVRDQRNPDFASSQLAVTACPSCMPCAVLKMTNQR